MAKIRDGDLYKIVNIYGREFELRYGYYEEYERGRGEPIPIYPDLRRQAVYTDDGYALVTQMQELCEHGSSPFKDGCCVDCKYYKDGEELIGICLNPKNKKASGACAPKDKGEAI